MERKKRREIYLRKIRENEKNEERAGEIYRLRAEAEESHLDKCAPTFQPIRNQKEIGPKNNYKHGPLQSDKFGLSKFIDLGEGLLLGMDFHPPKKWDRSRAFSAQVL